MLDLKKIISSIADAGQKLFKKPKIKSDDLDSIINLCDELLSNKGIVFGITVARDITNLYQELTYENKLVFFRKINEKYKPSYEEVDDAVKLYAQSRNEKSLSKLFVAAEGKRRELFRRMNIAPNGTAIIVKMREDLLSLIEKNKELVYLDSDLIHLFKAWFNPGFLNLEKITWETKALILEKIIKYERVHLMKDMNDLKRRLGEDRRFFSFFHPALEDEPVIFVQVALTKGLGKSIQEIMKPSSDVEKKYDTATFYSISNCQEGLARVTLGNFLIKRVIFEIQEELPHIKKFGTLSPIPGFVEWFNYCDKKKIEVILGKSNNDVSFLKSTDFKIGDGRIISNKENIIKLVAYYLINEKDLNGLPVGDVTRFHLRNGASINDIIINADISEAGFKRSFGVMVNYLYELNDIEKNHEDFVSNKKVIYSKELKKFL
ncbi:malonyl-CoA decarboxylase [Pelagibacteraceae bacterium]|jgi:malonyl-CoA decarboxylase|nr:malonyl-CoA decarboxylase [Pelagibacteraceae bacterium]